MPYLRKLSTRIIKLKLHLKSYDSNIDMINTMDNNSSSFGKINLYRSLRLGSMLFLRYGLYLDFAREIGER